VLPPANPCLRRHPARAQVIPYLMRRVNEAQYTRKVSNSITTAGPVIPVPALALATYLAVGPVRSRHAILLLL
jgi:hypothetical protein